MQHAAGDKLPRTIRRTVERYQMIVPGERVLVGLSGGPDSVALLSALVTLAPRLGISVTAAHLNHGLRGAEALRDQGVALQVAKILGVSCDVGSIALTPGSNLEARARDARYAFLCAAAERAEAQKLATGHTMDDQAETMVMRLVRGSGWKGLGAIAPVRDTRIIRPLIECTRSQVMAYLRANRLPFCCDSSNEDVRFLRNRVRKEVMPLLSSVNPGVGKTLASTASLLAAGSAVLHRHVSTALEDVTLPSQSLSIPILRGQGRDLALLTVYEWLVKVRGGEDLRAAHVQSVMAIAYADRPSTAVTLPNGARVVREYEILRFECEQPIACEDFNLPLPLEGVLQLDSGWMLQSRCVEANTCADLPRDLWSLQVDAASIGTSIVVRRTRPGDRIKPLGMRGHKKLQDIFVDDKVPRHARTRYPVLDLDGEILWVPGLARGHCGLIGAATRSVLCVTARAPRWTEPEP